MTRSQVFTKQLTLKQWLFITKIKLKQNKRKTTFCFSEIVLFQFCFSFISDVTTALGFL